MILPISGKTTNLVSMALNKEVFKTRSLTAVVFVIVMLAGLLWNFWSFVLLFTIIHFGCWFEFVKLMKKIHGAKFFPYCLLGLAYVTMPVLMMLSMYLQYINITANVKTPDPRVLPIGIIFSIWINDTMAYIVGSFIGKTPFSKISPKKTWEGTIGGVTLCVITIGLLGEFIPAAKEVAHWFWNNAFFFWVIIAAICAVFGTAGDLLESKIKRMADVKDSGSFMPGHGGFLDRFDSLLVATPFVWLYVQFFM